jgi:hypothetical protein
MTDLTQGRAPGQLDPEPTLFGTARVDPVVAPDGSTELSRAVEWINRRARRFAFGGMLRARLVGDPVAAANVRASTQPLRDFRNDSLTPVDDIDEAEVYGEPRTNWSPNP